jgi:hypothetical protein
MNEPPMTPQERLHAYLVHCTDQEIPITAELIEAWLIDHQIEVICTLPRKWDEMSEKVTKDKT